MDVVSRRGGRCRGGGWRTVCLAGGAPCAADVLPRPEGALPRAMRPRATGIWCSRCSRPPWRMPWQRRRRDVKPLDDLSHTLGVEIL